jgi:transposase
MSLASSPLPDDPEALRAFAASLQAELARKNIEITARDAEIHAKTLHIEKLKMQLAVLRRARFGRSSEKLDRDIEQLELLIGELEEETAENNAKTAADPARNDAAINPAPARRQPVRRPLPSHLPRETVVHEPACACPGCGGTVFSRIGQDEREVLEYVPSSFKVIQHVRPKLSCRACETIVQAPMPTLPIERGRPGPGLVSHVLVSKYTDHTPLHRQAVIYAREGVELDRATLADWVGQAVFLLTPLAEAIGRHVRAGVALHADDTTVPVLAPGLGKTKTGRLWVVVRDERPWGSGVPPAAFYRYSEDRKAIHAEALLAGCRGFLHADGYAGFERLYKPIAPAGEPPLIEVARAGPTCDENSTKCTRRPRHRSHSRRCSGSPPVRNRESDERIRTRASPRRTHRTCPATARSAQDLPRHLADTDQRQERSGRGGPLCPGTLEGAVALSLRRTARDDKQRRRARNARARAGPEELPVLRFRRRRQACRLHLTLSWRPPG